jgi:hypothetical protein
MILPPLESGILPTPSLPFDQIKLVEEVRIVDAFVGNTPVTLANGIPVIFVPSIVGAFVPKFIVCAPVAVNPPVNVKSPEHVFAPEIVCDPPNTTTLALNLPSAIVPVEILVPFNWVIFVPSMVGAFVPKFIVCVPVAVNPPVNVKSPEHVFAPEIVCDPPNTTTLPLNLPSAIVPEEIFVPLRDVIDAPLPEIVPLTARFPEIIAAPLTSNTYPPVIVDLLMAICPVLFIPPVRELTGTVPDIILAPLITGALSPKVITCCLVAYNPRLGFNAEFMFVIKLFVVITGDVAGSVAE